jgi:hypothetical protein
MKSNMAWMIRLGVILFITGIILMIFSAIVHIRPGSFIEADDEFQFNFIRLYGFVGIVLFLVGITLYITGMRDLYFKPLKSLLYPELHQKAPLKNPIRIELRYIECKYCRENIPINSNQCPYCGGKQKKEESLSLKKV